jgi:uncharacterized protein (UPF0216 family)
MTVELGNGALKKWLSLEAKGMHDGLVTKRKSLKVLLEEEGPSCTTRSKRKHVFDKNVLKTIAKHLPTDRHSQLLLPINIYVDLKVENQCYVEDELAASVLGEMEGFGKAYKFRKGRMWLPMSLTAELAAKYKAAIQMIFLV